HCISTLPRSSPPRRSSDLTGSTGTIDPARGGRFLRRRLVRRVELFFPFFVLLVPPPREVDRRGILGLRLFAIEARVHLHQVEIGDLKRTRLNSSLLENSGA